MWGIFVYAIKKLPLIARAEPSPTPRSFLYKLELVLIQIPAWGGYTFL